MAKYLLDTNQIIDYLRGREEIKELLVRLIENRDLICSCCITIAETYAGARAADLSVTGEFLDSLWYLDMTEEISEAAGRQKFNCAKRGITLSLSDALVGAIALTNDAVLITSNTRHFPVNGIRILEMRKSQ